VAQIFTNEGLTVLFNQVITASPVTYSQLYVGLFTGSLPTATSTLSTITEQSGSGYARKSITFGAPATATLYSTPYAQAPLNAGVTASNLVTTGTFTTGSYASLAVGMSVDIASATGGSQGSGAATLFVITALPGSPNVVLNAACTATTSAAMKFGDAVNGEKSVGPTVTFGPATGAWGTASAGYFICTVSSGTSGKLLYAANFADASTPTLAVNDTLAVTPTWLMSN
jgi:hypothetical protein